MITEDYVSFETAKLLKEKGFDEICSAIWRYWEDGIGEPYFIASLSYECDYTYCYNSMLKKSESDGEIDIACPTLQMAMKWLREVHNIAICICAYYPVDSYELNHRNNKPYWKIRITNRIYSRDYDSFNTYEEACEAAIKYCLKNLV